MEFTVSIESHAYGKSTEEMYGETLESGDEILAYLKEQGLPVDSVAIEQPAEFSRRGQKWIAKILITFALGAVNGVGEKVGEKAVEELQKQVDTYGAPAKAHVKGLLDKKFKHNAEVDVEVSPPSTPSQGPSSR